MKMMKLFLLAIGLTGALTVNASSAFCQASNSGYTTWCTKPTIRGFELTFDPLIPIIPVYGYSECYNYQSQ